MSHKIKITIHDDLYQIIKDYANNHDCTIAFAAMQICEIGAETLEGRAVRGIPNTWGGKRINEENYHKGNEG